MKHPVQLYSGGTTLARGAYTGMLAGRSAANTDPAKAEANANPTVSFFISARSALTRTPYKHP
jgi:hypothetical protein